MFGFGKKDWQATINSDRKLTVKAGENLLAAALAAGLPWSHDCRVGSCGSCRCHLKKGKIKALNDFSYVLTPEQLNAGMILACQTELKSDIEVEVELDESVAKVAAGNYEGVVKSLRKLTHDILEMTIACDAPLPDGILAGQYMDISYAGLSNPRSYSFAKAPENEPPGEATFYVRLVPGGEFTEWLFAEDRCGTRVTIAGPHGDFRLRKSGLPMVCIAGGSGMSAVKAVLEDACNRQSARDAILLFGARTQDDIYCLDELEHIARRWNPAHEFKFEYVLSNEPDDSCWKGARGFVTEYLHRSYIEPGLLDIKTCQAYMCGPPPMIDAGIKALTDAGLDEGSIFYDKFLDARTIPGGR